MTRRRIGALAATVAMAAVCTVPAWTVSSSSAAAATTTYLQAGATANLDRLPYSPPAAPVGGGRSLATSPAGLSAAIASLQPGDVLTVSAGTVPGNLTISANGTVAAPITIRATGAVTFASGCGGPYYGGGSCVDFEGSYVALEGFSFGTTQAFAVVMNGQHNTLYGSTFDQSGDGQGASSAALIFTQASGNATLVERSNNIVRNVFNQPRNGVYFQNHGAHGTILSHNIINGPNRINSGGETETIKIGWDFYAEQVDVVIQYNTFQNYGSAWPYTIGLKGSGVKVLYNLFDNRASGNIGGIIENRYGNNNSFVGNVMVGSDARWRGGGSGNVVKHNLFLASTTKDAFGPFDPYPAAARYDGQYTGTNGQPIFTMALANSTFEDNTFYGGPNLDGFNSTIAVVGNGGAEQAQPHGNSLTANRFVRSGQANQWIQSNDRGTFLTANTWTSNIFSCSTGCTDAQVSLELLGVSGNRAGGLAAPTTLSNGVLNSLDTTRVDHLVVCDPTYVPCGTSTSTGTVIDANPVPVVLPPTTTTTVAPTTTTTMVAATTTTTVKPATTTTATTVVKSAPAFSVTAPALVKGQKLTLSGNGCLNSSANVLVTSPSGSTLVNALFQTTSGNWSRVFTATQSGVYRVRGGCWSSTLGRSLFNYPDLNITVA